MSLSRKLIHTVEILRADPARSPTGTVAHSPPATAAAVCAGRLETLKGGRQLGPDGVAYEADAALYLPGGADVRPRPDAEGADGDWVRVEGSVYRVVHAHDVAGAGRLTRCLVKRVN